MEAAPLIDRWCHTPGRGKGRWHMQQLASALNMMHAPPLLAAPGCTQATAGCSLGPAWCALRHMHTCMPRRQRGQHRWLWCDPCPVLQPGMVGSPPWWPCLLLGLRHLVS